VKMISLRTFLSLLNLLSFEGCTEGVIDVCFFRSGLWHGQQCLSAWLPRVQGILTFEVILHCKSPSFITQSQLEHGNELIFGGICTVLACRIHGVLSRCWLLQASSIFVETFSYVHFLGMALQVLHGPQQPLRCATSSLSGGADIRNLKIFSHCLDSMNQSTFLFLGIPSPSMASSLLWWTS
jgi:hypothetical protein